VKGNTHSDLLRFTTLAGDEALRKGIKKERTSRTQFIKFATAVILRDKLNVRKYMKKFKAQRCISLYTQTPQKYTNTWKG
jgi:hypothetical protein